jgi:hypothetical protein
MRQPILWTRFAAQGTPRTTGDSPARSAAWVGTVKPARIHRTDSILAIALRTHAPGTHGAREHLHHR